MAPEQGSAPSRTRRVLEDLVLLLAIFPLWPKLVLGWQGAVWDLILYLDLAFLTVMLAVRWRRMRKALDRIEDGTKSGGAAPKNSKRSRILSR